MNRIATLAAQILQDDDALTILHKCGGYYECPKGSNDEYLGPLVGYAGRYDNGNGQQLQFVGDVYYNFAQAERFPHVRELFARGILDALNNDKIDFDAVIGAPMGGILLSGDIGRLANRRTVFMEKKVDEVETPTSREKSHLIMDRHELSSGDLVVLSEDVVNNLSTTGKALEVINAFGAKLVAITCAFNRSGKKQFVTPSGASIPIICYKWIPTQQFRQDDPAVATHIAQGYWVPKPKDHWGVLMTAMKR
ncbi:MAG: hypothetical protein WC794_02495 [Candidatus Doudnabacteria bacterium]|jgi:orotate phosphoribosyltransferase